jgi:hypothetical protein
VYRAILSHIHDADVRKLAFGAVFVRRLTADVIRYVLAGPCGVNVPDASDAQRLFDSFSYEVWLVSEDADGSLKFRPEMRRHLLPFLVPERPNAAINIHSAAISYYEGYDDVVSRAEELYHRLCLGDSPAVLDQRWQRGVENHLASSLEELPAESQAYLASRLNRPHREAR